VNWSTLIHLFLRISLFSSVDPPLSSSTTLSLFNSRESSGIILIWRSMALIGRDQSRDHAHGPVIDLDPGIIISILGHAVIDTYCAQLSNK